MVQKALRFAFIAFICFAVDTCVAIECNFRYGDDDLNYPEQLIDVLVDRNFAIDTSIHSNKEFKCDDKYEEHGNLIEISETRLDESSMPPKDDLGESLCVASTKSIRPKSLPSIKDSSLVTVINHGEFYQTVTIEECKNTDEPCQFVSNFPQGYTTKCKQKYQMHTIKSLSEDQKSIVDKFIYYPSGCECRVYSMKN